MCLMLVECSSEESGPESCLPSFLTASSITISKVLTGCALGRRGSFVAPQVGARLWVPCVCGCRQAAPSRVLGEGLLTEPRSGVRAGPWPWCGEPAASLPLPHWASAQLGDRAMWVPCVCADLPVTSLVSLYLNLGWGCGGWRPAPGSAPEGLWGWGGPWAHASLWALRVSEAQCGEPGASWWLCRVLGISERLSRAPVCLGLKPAPSGVRPVSLRRVDPWRARHPGGAEWARPLGCLLRTGVWQCLLRSPCLLLQRGADTRGRFASPCAWGRCQEWAVGRAQCPWGLASASWPALPFY